MVREELVAGIRNALDRGQSLEQAIQSMITAGYAENEVNEAVTEFRRLGVNPIVKEIETEKQTMQKKLQEIKKQSSGGISTKKFLLIILLVILISGIAAGGLYAYFSKLSFSELLDKVVGIFKN